MKRKTEKLVRKERAIWIYTGAEHKEDEEQNIYKQGIAASDARENTWSLQYNSSYTRGSTYPTSSLHRAGCIHKAMNSPMRLIFRLFHTALHKCVMRCLKLLCFTPSGDVDVVRAAQDQLRTRSVRFARAFFYFSIVFHAAFYINLYISYTLVSAS